MAEPSDAEDGLAPVRVEIESGAVGSVEAPLADRSRQPIGGTKAVVGLGVLIALFSLVAVLALRPDPSETADGSARTATTVPRPSTTASTRVEATTTIDPDGSDRIAAERTQGLINAGSVVEADSGYLALGFATAGPPELRRSVDGILWQPVESALGPAALALFEDGRINAYEALIGTDDGYALLATINRRDGVAGESGSLIRLRSDSGVVWDIDQDFAVQELSELSLGVSAHTDSTITLIEAEGFADTGLLTVLNAELPVDQQVTDGCGVDRPSPTELIVISCSGNSRIGVRAEDLIDSSRSRDVFDCASQLAAVTTPIGETSLVVVAGGQDRERKDGPRFGGRFPGVTVGDSFLILEEGNRHAGADFGRCEGIAVPPPAATTSVLVWGSGASPPTRLSVPEMPASNGSALLTVPDQDIILYVGDRWLWTLDLETNEFTRLVELPDSERGATQTYVTTDGSRLVHIDEARIFVAEFDPAEALKESQRPLSMGISWSKSQLFPRNAVRSVLVANAQQLIALTDIGYVSIRLREALGDAGVGPGHAEPVPIGAAQVTSLNTRVELRSITAAGGGYLALGAAPDIEGLLAPNILVSADGVAWVTIPTGLSGVDVLVGSSDQRVTRTFDSLSALDNQLVVSMIEVLSDRVSGEVTRTVVTRLASVDGRSWTPDSEFTPFEISLGSRYFIANTSDVSAISVVSDGVGNQLIELAISLEVTDPAVEDACWAGVAHALGTSDEGTGVTRLVPCDGAAPIDLDTSQLRFPNLADEFSECLLELDGLTQQTVEISAQRRGDSVLYIYNDVGVAGSLPVVAANGEIVVLDLGRSLALAPSCAPFDRGVAPSRTNIGIVSITPNGPTIRRGLPVGYPGGGIVDTPSAMVLTDTTALVSAGNEVYGIDRSTGRWNLVMEAPEPYQQIWLAPNGQRLFAVAGPQLFVAEPSGQWVSLDIGNPISAESMIYADDDRAFFRTSTGPIVIDFPELG